MRYHRVEKNKFIRFVTGLKANISMEYFLYKVILYQLIRFFGVLIFENKTLSGFSVFYVHVCLLLKKTY
ncbi:hypothetical protein F887_03214 [Acinetobacter sp. NIPH 2100]|nr:hypothetical protein F887_03214 [Acinetobacter sp. NIPH 2100]